MSMSAETISMMSITQITNLVREAVKNYLANFFLLKVGEYLTIPLRKKCAKSSYFWPKNANLSPF